MEMRSLEVEGEPLLKFEELVSEGEVTVEFDRRVIFRFEETDNGTLVPGVKVVSLFEEFIKKDGIALATFGMEGLVCPLEGLKGSICPLEVLKGCISVMEELRLRLGDGCDGCKGRRDALGVDEDDSRFPTRFEETAGVLRFMAEFEEFEEFEEFKDLMGFGETAGVLRFIEEFEELGLRGALRG